MSFFSKRVGVVVGVLSAVLIFPISVFAAASFELSPSGGSLVAGCSQTIKVIMKTDSVVNGAQVYLNYSGLGNADLSIEKGTAFSSYGVSPEVLPSNMKMRYGYGADVIGQNLEFANIVFSPQQVGSNVLLTINTTNINNGTKISKIARALDGQNILTNTIDGSYTVVSGYCDYNDPVFVSSTPAKNAVNFPVDKDIILDVTDTGGSGIDANSFLVEVTQGGSTVPVQVSYTKIGLNDNHYLFTVHPVSNLIPQVKVTVNASVRDRANNSGNENITFNDLTCQQLGCVDSGTITPTSTSSSTSSGGGTGITPQCSDHEDNDGDGLIDYPADPGCKSPEWNNEYVAGEAQNPNPTTGGGTQTSALLTVDNVHFYLAQGSIEAHLGSGSTLEHLPQSSLKIAVDTNIGEGVTAAKVILGEMRRDMFFDNALKKYAVELFTPEGSSVIDGTVTVVHGSITESVPFHVVLLPLGKIFTKTVVGGEKNLAGAHVFLDQLTGANNFVPVKEAFTNENGEYSFVVPNGGYRLRVQTSGISTEETAGFRITNNIVNRPVGILIPPNPDASLSEQIQYVAEVVARQSGKTLGRINDPQVEKIVGNQIAPLAAATTALAVVPALSLLNLLSYLRYLFLQPLLLLRRRQRKEWGVVYNTLNKLPVDLAVVRLIEVSGGKVVQSRVTDREGRFAFFVSVPGLYRVEVNKDRFIFPSKILQGISEDTSFLDLYHGEPIHVDVKDTVVAVNIPLDPMGGIEKTPSRIIWDRSFRQFQVALSQFSIAAGIISLLITPTWFVGGLLVLQVVLYALFRRLSQPNKPKSWGIVSDLRQKTPVERVIARLFSKQFDKLVATEVTDGKGRYSFLAGPSDYYVTFEKNGYKKEIVEGVRVKEHGETVKKDVSIQKIEEDKK